MVKRLMSVAKLLLIEGAVLLLTTPLWAAPHSRPLQAPNLSAEKASLAPTEWPAMHEKMEFHENEGCPMNSLCDKKMGPYRKKWLDFLSKLEKRYPSHNPRGTKEKIKALESYRQKHGLPTGIWATLDSSKGISPILWDSACQHHQHKVPGKAVMQGEVFIQDTKNGVLHVMDPAKKVDFPISQEGPLLDQIILRPSEEASKKLRREASKKSSSSLRTYFVPRGEVPHRLNHLNMEFTRDAEGLYYTLQISPKGEWKVKHPPEGPPAERKEVPCPQDLEKYFLESSHRHRLYSGHSCRQIRDSGTQMPYIMLVPWSCH